jgi:hypothetical protein
VDKYASVKRALIVKIELFDRAHRNPISFAGGPHRDPKRPALSEHRDAEWARDMMHAPLLVAPRPFDPTGPCNCCASLSKAASAIGDERRAESMMG